MRCDAREMAYLDPCWKSNYCCRLWAVEELMRSPTTNISSAGQPGVAGRKFGRQKYIAEGLENHAQEPCSHRGACTR